PGETGPSLFVDEASPGNHDYVLGVVCSPPPVGLACSGSSAPVRLSFTPSGAPPTDRGNTLRAARRGDDVEVSWAVDPSPATTAYDLLAAAAKTELADPLAPPPVLLGGLGA